MKIKYQYIISFALLFLAVAIGAFGAHALKAVLVDKYLVTFKTGSQYHFYHGLALFMVAILNDKYENIFKQSYNFIFAGVLLFSFNCYLYSILHVKTFAMIVPIGGVSLLIGWILLAYKFSKKEIK